MCQSPQVKTWLGAAASYALEVCISVSVDSADKLLDSVYIMTTHAEIRSADGSSDY